MQAFKIVTTSEGLMSLCSPKRVAPKLSSCAAACSGKEVMSDAYALNLVAGDYERGIKGMPQDFAKANELYLKAGELGCAEAYHNLGSSYYNGEGVEVDKKKAKHYLELAAMNGDIFARYNLGCLEGQTGNHHRAMKHFLLAARAGYKNSLDVVKDGFMDGFVTKDEYENTLRAYHERYNEMKSDTRDKAGELD